MKFHHPRSLGISDTELIMHKFNIADADAAGESDPYVAPACLSSRNEIFKVKLISIKAYSPQDIISLI